MCFVLFGYHGNGNGFYCLENGRLSSSVQFVDFFQVFRVYTSYIARVSRLCVDRYQSTYEYVLFRRKRTR